MDICYQYVNEMVINGFFKIVFVKTKENVVDIFTKNVTSEVYKTLVKSFLSEWLLLNDKWINCDREGVRIYRKGFYLVKQLKIP